MSTGLRVFFSQCGYVYVCVRVCDKLVYINIRDYIATYGTRSPCKVRSEEIIVREPHHLFVRELLLLLASRSVFAPVQFKNKTKR